MISTPATDEQIAHAVTLAYWGLALFLLGFVLLSLNRTLALILIAGGILLMLPLALTVVMALANQIG